MAANIGGNNTPPVKSKSNNDLDAPKKRKLKPSSRKGTPPLNKSGPQPDLNPLALPKGERHPCEFCGAPRSLYICHGCMSAYYCSNEHKNTSYHVVHKAVCDDYSYIRTCPKPVHPQRARERFTKLIHMKQEEIVMKCIRLAETSLRERRSKDAILQIAAGLKLQMGIKGFRSPALVPTYCMLADAMTRDGRHADAHGELIKASHIIEEHREDFNLESIALYHRVEGCYYMAVGDLQEACTSFAQEVYYATQAYHPEHKLTSYGYFHLGQVFLILDQVTIAHSHYMHAMDIWFEYLSKLFAEKTKSDKNRIRDFDYDKQVMLTVNDRTIAREILATIKADMVDKKWGGSSIDSAKICLALSLCLFLESNDIGELEEAIELSRRFEFQTVQLNPSAVSVCEPSLRGSLEFVVHDDEVEETQTAVKRQISRARKAYQLQCNARLEKKERETEVELQRLAHDIRTQASRALNRMLIAKDPKHQEPVSLSNMESKVASAEQSTGKLSFAFSGRLVQKLKQVKKKSHALGNSTIHEDKSAGLDDYRKKSKALGNSPIHEDKSAGLDD